MRIGLEATSICKPRPTGIQKYIVNQLHALDALLGTEEDVSAFMLCRASRWNRRAYLPKLTHIPRRWYGGRFVPVPGRYSVMHALDARLPLSVARNIFTVCDLAFMRKEYQFDAFASSRFRERKAKQLRSLARGSRAVITISHATKSDVVSLLDLPADRVHVIYPGLDQRYARADRAPLLAHEGLRRFGLVRKRYLLFVGTPTERKNASRILRAFLESSVSSDFELAIAGDMDESVTRETAALIDQGASRGIVRVLGYVDDEVLFELYDGAAALIQPTLYEGFGLPIIEAMSRRTPVIAGNRGAAPEVAAGHAAIADPFSIDSIAEGIETALAFSGAQLDAAQAHAFSYTSERSAQQTLELYRTVAAE
jgi:glycosyltransferase involved in cell wall biosynthesis